MTIYAVMVLHTGERWIDSLWVRKYEWQDGAEKRVKALRSMFDALGCSAKVWLADLELEDAVLANKPDASETEALNTEVQESGGI